MLYSWKESIENDHITSLSNSRNEISTSPIYGLNLVRLASKKSSCTNSVHNVDILPSYQMHQSVLNSITESETESADLELPVYTGSDPVIDPPRENLGVVDGSDLSHMANNSFFDNIHTMPIISKRDIAISIEILEKKNLFTNGDFISGIVTIENLSNKDIKFELLFTSLEGISRVSPVDYVSDNYRMRCFLRMVDLGGSWTEADEEIRISKSTISGLPRNKILLANMKYQKPFKFRIPQQGLETSCVDNVAEHNQLPPSIGKNYVLIPPKGIDFSFEEKDRFNLNDLSSMAFSINYSVNVRLITKTKRCTVVSSLARYLLRVIPSRNKDDQTHTLSPEKSLDLLKRIIRNDIKHASNREIDSQKLKSDNVFIYSENCFQNIHSDMLFSCSFEIGLKNNTLPMVNQEKTDNISVKGTLTFSTSSAIKLNYKNISTPLAVITQPYIFNIDLHLFYEFERSGVEGIQQSYRSISKLDNIVPTDIVAELHYINVHAKGLPIPIELDPMWFTSEDIFQQKITQRFKELSDQVENLPQEAEMYASNLQLMRAMKNLTFESNIISKAISANEIRKSQTEIMGNNNLQESYRTTLNIWLKLDNNKLKSVMLLPNFQNCSISRFYFIRFKLKSTKYFDSNYLIRYNSVNGVITDKAPDKKFKFYIDVPLEIHK